MNTASTPSQGQLLPTRQVLLIEDEALFARAVSKRLERSGFQVTAASLLEEGLALVKTSVPDLVLLDLRLPDGDGLSKLEAFTRAEDGTAIPLIVLTAFGDVEDAVLAMKQGASDYLKKPIDLDELMLVVEGVLKSRDLKDQLDFSRERDSRAFEGVHLVGKSDAIQHLRAHIEQIAKLSGTGIAPPSVMIQGETGSGKDVVARLLHQASANRAQPFVHVDCAALPGDLIEAELFGHEKGAFTGASGARAGLIEAAEGGTLFLDEIGELPLALQAKLLAVIERRQVRRIGSVKERPVAARFISASHRDLLKMSELGEFRADLYYRLNVLSIVLPPLRERGGDILLLAQHYADITAKRYGLKVPLFSDEARARMLNYAWPGNVRELRNLVERAVLLSGGATITAPSLGVSAPEGEVGLEVNSGDRFDALTLMEAEKLLIERALQSTQGNVSEAARKLGVTRMTLRYRMQKHHLGMDISDELSEELD